MVLLKVGVRFGAHLRYWPFLLLFGCGQGVVSNETPVVSVSAPSEVVERSEVKVTSSSTDVDGTVNSYLWRQTAGPSINLNSVTSPLLEFTAPNVDDDAAITLELIVTDNDGGEASSGDITIIVRQSLADDLGVDATDIVERDTESSVFISSLLINIEPNLVSEVSFEVNPLTGAVASPLRATYTSANLSRLEEGLILPVFGLYQNKYNVVEVTLRFVDDSTTTLQVELATEAYVFPFSMETTKLPEFSNRPSFSYFYLKSYYGIHIFDIDGYVRWAPNVPVNSISSIYDDGDFVIFLDDEMHRQNLSGESWSTRIELEGLANIEAHHDVEIGSVGYLVEVDTDKEGREERIIESVLLEVSAEGKVLREWDFGSIFKSFIEDAGYDPGGFVRDGSDWFHMNSAIYDPSENAIIASSRENFVVAIDYDLAKLLWILGDETKHWYVNYPPLRALSLTSADVKPIGQHSLSVVEEGLLLFNNGQHSFQNPEGTPQGKILESSPVSVYQINTSSYDAEIVWNYDPLIYSDICSSAHLDSSIPDGDFLVNYSVVDRLADTSLDKPTRTVIRGVDRSQQVLFQMESPTRFCRVSWQSRPLAVMEDLRFVD